MMLRMGHFVAGMIGWVE